MIENNIDTIKTNLLAKKEDLIQRLDKIHKNKTKSSGPLDANSTEQAVELQSKDVIDALDNIETQELLKVDAALKQIENGNYGNCISCEEAISPSRLKALPHVLNCINCVKKIDK